MSTTEEIVEGHRQIRASVDVLSGKIDKIHDDLAIHVLEDRVVQTKISNDMWWVKWGVIGIIGGIGSIVVFYVESHL